LDLVPVTIDVKRGNLRKVHRVAVVGTRVNQPLSGIEAGNPKENPSGIDWDFPFKSKECPNERRLADAIGLV
jgi:hypothetical protein